MFEWLTALFNAITGVSKAVEKGLPTEKIQEEKFEIKKQRITLKERDKILRESELFLDFRPRLLPIDYVNWKFDSLDNDDVQDILTILNKKYSKRINRGLKLKQ